ncbi:MAG TPA: hypothetical protein VK914_10880 [bacterium]|jgi:hypothetical protein|nr:hypothetical protein [bacterium]
MLPRRACLLLALLCLSPRAARAGFWDDAWLDPALLQAQDLNGGSGFIHVPLPQSLPDGLLTGSIHSYQIQAGRGFADGIEAGGEVQLDAWDPQTQEEIDGWTRFNAGKENLFYFRWSPLQQGPHCPIGLSVGTEGVGIQDIDYKQVPLASLKGLERQYVVAGGMVPDLPMLYVAGGFGGGDQPAAGFGAMAFAPFPGMAAMAEYNEGFTDVGVRVLLSTRIKLDLDLSRLQSMYLHQPFDLVLTDNVTFGVSYSEVWP